MIKVNSTKLRQYFKIYITNLDIVIIDLLHN